MLSIVAMKLFAKEMEQGEEEQENYDHESKNSSNTVEHRDNPSLTVIIILSIHENAWKIKCRINDL